jgi:endo-1,4-beta-xylanase
VALNGSFSKNELEKQADIYPAAVRVCIQNPGRTAIPTWGFTDKYSWMGSHSRSTRGGALLFDRLYRSKPAYERMMEEILKRSNR